MHSFLFHIATYFKITLIMYYKILLKFFLVWLKLVVFSPKNCHKNIKNLHQKSVCHFKYCSLLLNLNIQKLACFENFDKTDDEIRVTLDSLNGNNSDNIIFLLGGYGMLGRLGCDMFGMWDIQDVRCRMFTGMRVVDLQIASVGQYL